MKTFKEFLKEGVNDKGILKAIFIIGLAAAGKSTVSEPLSFFAKHIDVDFPQEYFSEKYGIDLGKEGEMSKKKEIRQIGKRITTERIYQYVNGLLPMVINVVGDNIDNTLKRIDILKKFGYDVGMIFINIDKEISKSRVASRRYGKEKSKHRYIPPEKIDQSYEDLLKSVDSYKSKLDNKLSFFKEISHTGIITPEQQEEIRKLSMKFFDSKVENEIGKSEIATLKKKGDKYLSDIISPLEIEAEIKRWF